MRQWAIVKFDRRFADTGHMEFVHRCHFCDWQRETSSPTILKPHCEQCGSLLDSVRADALASSQIAEPLPVPSLRVSPSLALGLRIATFATVLFTAAVTGFNAGGPWIAVGACGAASLVVAPSLVPD